MLRNAHILRLKVTGAGWNKGHRLTGAESCKYRILNNGSFFFRDVMILSDLRTLSASIQVDVYFQVVHYCCSKFSEIPLYSKNIRIQIYQRASKSKTPKSFANLPKIRCRIVQDRFRHLCRITPPSNVGPLSKHARRGPFSPSSKQQRSS